jgi:hypothetical protein
MRFMFSLDEFPVVFLFIVEDEISRRDSFQGLTQSLSKLEHLVISFRLVVCVLSTPQAE